MKSLATAIFILKAAFLFVALLFFGDSVFAAPKCVVPDVMGADSTDSPEKCTTYCGVRGSNLSPNFNGAGYSIDGSNDTRSMCCCKNTGTAPGGTGSGPGSGSGSSGTGGTGGAGGGSGSGGAGSSARVRTRASTGAGKPACNGGLLSGPQDAPACGAACGRPGQPDTAGRRSACGADGCAEALFEPDGFSNGSAKCCCYAPRGPGSAAGEGTFGPNVANPFGAVFDVPMLVGKTLRWFMGILGVIALVIFIYGGFLWMISLGDETRVKKGRETMIWAGMGLIAIVGSYVVIQFILETVL